MAGSKREVSRACAGDASPCPFCGTDPREIGSGILWAIYCPACEDVAQFEHGETNARSDECDLTTRERALWKWNRRLAVEGEHHTELVQQMKLLRRTVCDVIGFHELVEQQSVKLSAASRVSYEARVYAGCVQLARQLLMILRPMENGK